MKLKSLISLILLKENKSINYFVDFGNNDWEKLKHKVEKNQNDFISKISKMFLNFEDSWENYKNTHSSENAMFNYIVERIKTINKNFYDGWILDCKNAIKDYEYDLSISDQKVKKQKELFKFFMDNEDQDEDNSGNYLNLNDFRATLEKTKKEYDVDSLLDLINKENELIKDYENMKKDRTKLLSDIKNLIWE